MTRTHVDEPRLLATAIAVLGGAIVARGAAQAFGLAMLLGVVLASVGAMTIGVLLLKLAVG